MDVFVEQYFNLPKYCILGESMSDDKKYIQVFRQGDVCHLLISSEELKKICRKFTSNNS